MKNTFWSSRAGGPARHLSHSGASVTQVGPIFIHAFLAAEGDGSEQTRGEARHLHHTEAWLSILWLSWKDVRKSMIPLLLQVGMQHTCNTFPQ